MKCSRCGAINNDGARFCVKCLSPLRITNNTNAQSNVAINNGANAQPNVALNNGVNAQPNVAINNGMNVQPNVTPNNGVNVQPNVAINNGANAQPNVAPNNGVNAQPNVDSNSQNSNATNDEIDNSVIRRSIKKEAKSRKKGPVRISYIIMMVVFTAITLITTFLSIQKMFNQFSQLSFVDTPQVNMGDNILSVAVSIMIIVVECFLLLVFIKTALEVSRGNKITVGNAFQYTFHHFGNVFKVFGVSILLIIISIASVYLLLGVVDIFPIFSVIVLLALIIYLFPILYVYLFTVVDDMDSKDIEVGKLSKSMKLVKGHRVEYYALSFSFIGWILLGTIVSTLISTFMLQGVIKVLTLNMNGSMVGAPIVLSVISVLVMSLPMTLFSIWLVPYMTVAFANWYRHLNKEAEFKSASDGITNGNLIALVILGFVIVMFVMYLLNR